VGTIQANDDPSAGLVEKEKVAQLKQVATRNIRMTGNCDHFLRISIVPSTNKHRYITTSFRICLLSPTIVPQMQASCLRGPKKTKNLSF
jgi:hypothetical protein